ncbi:hypothetical protein AOLI_G00214960 [Acnodon oligacanthus]
MFPVEVASKTRHHRGPHFFSDFSLTGRGAETRTTMLSKIIGQKYVSIARTWVPTLTLWGGVGGIALVHFTDWRLILDYVPYINGKFKKDD